MPSPISGAAWTFLAVFFAWDGWRRRQRLAREFRAAHAPGRATPPA
jgi:hypothetical protein